MEVRLTSVVATTIGVILIEFQVIFLPSHQTLLNQELMVKGGKDCAMSLSVNGFTGMLGKATHSVCTPMSLVVRLTETDRDFWCLNGSCPRYHAIGPFV